MNRSALPCIFPAVSANGENVSSASGTAGSTLLPKQLREHNRERWLRSPGFKERKRSLNLLNDVAMVLFDALWQKGSGNEICSIVET